MLARRVDIEMQGAAVGPLDGLGFEVHGQRGVRAALRIVEEEPELLGRHDERQDAVAAARLGLAAADPLIYLERQRLANDEPLAWDRVWLPARMSRPLLDVDFTDTALYVEMNRLLGRGPTGGREEIGCRNATTEEAERLDLESGAAVFSLSRIGCHHGEPVEYRETLVRGDRFFLVTQFSPGSGYFLTPGTPGDQHHRPHIPARAPTSLADPPESTVVKVTS